MCTYERYRRWLYWVYSTSVKVINIKFIELDLPRLRLWVQVLSVVLILCLFMESSTNFEYVL